MTLLATDWITLGCGVLGNAVLFAGLVETHRRAVRKAEAAQVERAATLGAAVAALDVRLNHLDKCIHRIDDSSKQMADAMIGMGRELTRAMQDGDGRLAEALNFVRSQTPPRSEVTTMLSEQHRLVREDVQSLRSLVEQRLLRAKE